MTSGKAPTIDEAALGRLVAQFYAKARLDPVLGPVFERAIDDWPPHLAQITAFWTSAMLGAKTYRGNPLAQHLKHPLTPEMFDIWLALWAETAKSVFDPAPAAALAERAGRIAESLKLGLFFNPTGPRGAGAD